jgi:hypothetical protein
MLLRIWAYNINKINKNNNYQLLRLHSKCKKIQLIFKLFNRDLNINRVFNKKIMNNNQNTWIKIKLYDNPKRI